MATLYPDRIIKRHLFGEAVSYPIRKIGLSDLTSALRLGWEDFQAMPSHAIVVCVIYPVLGLVLFRMVLGHSVLPLLFPLAAGFALIGPFAASCANCGPASAHVAPTSAGAAPVSPNITGTNVTAGCWSARTRPGTRRCACSAKPRAATGPA